ALDADEGTRPNSVTDGSVHQEQRLALFRPTHFSTNNAPGNHQWVIHRDTPRGAQCQDEIFLTDFFAVPNLNVRDWLVILDLDNRQIQLGIGENGLCGKSSPITQHDFAALP